MTATGTTTFIVTPEILRKVESLASQGLTTVQIGDVLGVHERTVYRYKENDRQFRQAIKEGQAKGVATISNALFQSARGGHVVAQIFYLKNRASDAWRDRKELEHQGPGGGPVQVITSSMTPQEAAAAYADTLNNE